MQATTLQLDGATWNLRFQGWDAPLGVETADGFGWLRPWTLALHLPALASATRPGDDGPALDEVAFAKAVLAACWPAGAAEELIPLALWWAAAPGASGPDRDGWLALGDRRARLEPWSWGARAAALAAAVGEDGLDLARWLACQIEASVVQVEPAGADPLELPAGPVLAALVALHTPPRIPEAVAAQTLRAARALGWTPGRVLAAPSPEIDLLLQLLDGEATEPLAWSPAPAAGPVWTGLAAWPDAIVIQVED